MRSMTQTRRVVFQPNVYRTLQKGIGKIVDAVRPTYGPLHGNVMVERIEKSMLPDILDDGGVIARRIIELPDRNEDVGAMMVRHLMWRMHERYGDATVTAALIYQSIFDQGVRHVLNGGNAMLLRRCLDKGAQLVMEALAKATQPITNQEQMTCLARTLCPDEDIAHKLGEIFMHIRQNGQLEIKAGRGRESSVEFINGMTWKGEFFLRSMIMDKFKYRSELEEPAILVSNLIIYDPYELAEWLERITGAGVKKLILLAREIAPDCLTILEAARRNPENFDVIAVKLWETTEHWELQDLAILTGGGMFAREAGYTLKSISAKELGRARQVWVERAQFGIIDGGGNAEIIQRHAMQMLMALQRSSDERFKRRLQARIAGFTGKSAVYLMGGVTQTEIEERVKLAERTANTLRGALADGILPGGAIALIECLPALEPLLRSEDEEERFAAQMISRALQAPLHALVTNCGENPLDIRARMKRRGKGYGFDVRNKKVRNMLDAGIYDMANAVKAAAYAGITAAALGLTVDVVVHPKKRKESYTTG
jgi:chaperonin GroEL